LSRPQDLLDGGYGLLAILVKVCFLKDTKFYLTDIVNISGYNYTI